MTPVHVIFERLDLRDAGAVVDALDAGTRASRDAACRRGSVEMVHAGEHERLIATGDLHDNPLYLMRLCVAAGMEGEAELDPSRVKHLTLHELIHGERLINGMDFSYRVLTRAAALKAQWPEHVHVLLANHELAQAMGQQVAKDGVWNNQAFDEAIDATFGSRAGDVRNAVKAFVLSMPLALKIEREGRGAVLCAHSLPGPEAMDRFDMSVLERELRDDDYIARQGSAHLMVWGRGHTPEQIEQLAQRWNVELFILGHEKAPEGTLVISPRCIVLNSDHDRAVYADVHPPAQGLLDASDVVRATKSLSES